MDGYCLVLHRAMKLIRWLCLMALIVAPVFAGPPLDDGELPPGSGVGSSAPQLQQTLVATANRESDFDCTTGGCSETANTVAGTKDSNDGTADQLNVAGDSFVIGDGHLGVIYTVTTAAVAGTIDFVRIICRARVTDPQGLGTIYGLAGVDAIGAQVPLTTSYASYTFEGSTDPVDSNPWTNAKINSRKWGFFVTGQSGDPDDASDSEVTEYRVEVWGH